MMELVYILTVVSKHTVTDIGNRLVVGCQGQQGWGRNGLGVGD